MGRVDGKTLTLRLELAYDAELYFRCDRHLPWHPDNILEEAVGQPDSDGGMGCNGRDKGFQPFRGDYSDVLGELAEVGFPVQVRLFERLPAEADRPSYRPLRLLAETTVGGCREGSCEVCG